MKRWLRIGSWAFAIITVMVLLGFAANEQQKALVKRPVVTISAIDENAFLTEEELLQRLKRKGLLYHGQEMGSLKTTEIEAFVKTMHEVENVDVFRRMG